jgi:WD40 repeat protein
MHHKSRWSFPPTVGVLFALFVSCAFSQEATPPPQIRYLEGHKGAVYAVAASPDGHSLLSAGVDGTIRIWDRETGLLVRSISAHSATVLKLTVAPDGRRFASSGLHGKINVFDLPGRNPLANIINVPGLAATLAVSPNGALVATGDNAPALRLWNTANGQHLRDFGGLTAAVTGAAFLNDGQFIVAAATDGTLRGWKVADGAAAGLIQTSPVSSMSVFSSDDPANGHLLAMSGADGSLRLFRWPPVPPQTLAGHSDQVTAVVISHDGKLVATGGIDQLVNLDDAATGKTVRALAGQPGKVASLAFSPDDSLLAAGSDTGTIKFWITTDGANRLTVAGHTGAVNAVAFHPKAKQIASAGADGTVRIWSLPSTPRVLKGHAMPVASLSMTADGKVAASVGSDKSIRLWTLADGKQQKVFSNLPQPLSETALSPDGKQLAAGDTLGDIRVWNLTGNAAPQLLGAHVGGVSGLAFDPRGSLLYSSGFDGMVKLWKLPVAAPTILPPHKVAVHAVALSPDGKLIASGATDGSLQIVDRVSGKLLKQIKASTATITGLAFSADNSLIAASDGTGTVTLWNAADGAARGRIAGHSGAVQSVAFHPSLNDIATAGADGTIRLWQTPGPLSVLAGHTKPVRSLSLSADGTRVLTAAEDGSVRLWNAKDGKPATTLLAGTIAVRSSDWSADGKQVAIGDDAGSIRLQNPADGTNLGILSAHQGAVTGLAFRAQNDILASTGADGLLRLWTLPIKSPQQLAKYTTAVKAISVSGDSKLAVVADSNKTLHVIDLAGNKETATVASLPGQATAVDVSPDKSLIAAATDAGTVDVYAAVGGAVKFRVVGHAGGATAVAFHPQGKQLASVGVDGTLRIWDIAIAPKLLAGHTKSVTAVAVSPTGKLLATGSNDNSVRLWNLANGAPVRTLSGHTAAITGLAWSADETRLASSSADKTARLWNVADGKQLAQFVGHTAAVNDVALSPNGATVVTASADKLVKVWNVAEVIKATTEKKDGEVGETNTVRDLAGHTKGVNSVLLIGNDATVISASADGTIRTWTVADGKMARNTNTGAPVRDIAISPDGKLLAAAGEDKIIHVYNPADGKLVVTLTGHAQPVTGVAFSRDNTRLLGAAADGTVGVWESGGRLLELRKLADLQPNAVSFGLDNQSLILGGTDNSVKLIPVALSRLIVASEAALSGVAWTPDGNSLLTGGADKTVKLWNAANGQAIRVFSGNTAAVTSVAVSRDGVQVLSSGADKTVRLWTTASAAVVATLTHPAVVYSAKFSADGSRIVTAADDFIVRAWDVASQQILQQFTEHTKPVRAALFAGNNLDVLSAGDDATVHRSQIAASAVIAAHVGGALSIAFLPKGDGVISAGADNRVVQFDLTGKLVREYAGCTLPVRQVLVRSDSLQVAAICDDKQVYQWQAANGQLIRKTPVAAVLTAAAYTPNGTRLVVGAADNQLRAFDTETGQLLERIELSAAVTALATLPDNVSLAVGLADNSAVMAQLSFRRLLAGHTGVVNTVAWTTDGKSLLSGGADKTVRHWNAETGALVRTMSGHTQPVTSVVPTDDAAQVISTSADKTIRIWTLANGAPLKSIPVSSIIHRIALNSKSNRLTGVGDDGVVRVWDPVVGRELQRFVGHAGVVRGVAISGDGNTVISGGDDKSVRLWPVSAIGIVVADATKVHDLELLPDGTHFVTAGEDKVVKLWDSAGKLVRSFGGSAAAVAHVAVSDDGKQIAAGGDPLFAQKNVLVWNTADAKLLQNIPTLAAVTALQFGSEGRLAVGGADKHLRVYSATDARLLQDVTAAAVLGDVRFIPGESTILAAAADNNSYLFDYSLLKILTGHDGAVTGVAFTQDGNQLLTAGADGTARLWNLADGKVVSTLVGSAGAISSLVVTADGKRAIVGRADKNVDIFDLPQQPTPQLKPTTTLTQPAPVTALAADKSADRIAIGGSDNTIRLWSLKTGTEVERLAGHAGPVLTLALTADGATLFSGSADKTARRWTPSNVDAVTAHVGNVNTVQFSGDGRQIFTAGAEKTIKSWTTIGLQPLQSYTGATAAVTSLAVSPDGKLLAAVGEEPVVRIWATDRPQPATTHMLPSPQAKVLFGTAGQQLLVAGTDKIVRNFGIVRAAGKLQLELTQEGHGHTEAITGLAVAADNHTLFSVAADKTVKRWYAASHAPVLTLTEPKGAVYGLTFSPDGLLLAAGGADKTVRIWDGLKGELMQSLTGHTRAISAVAFHNTGKELASTSYDGTIRLWSVVDVVPVDPKAAKEPPGSAAAPKDAVNVAEEKPVPPDRSPKPGLLAFTFGNSSFTGAVSHEVVSQLDLDWGKAAANLSRVWVGTLTLPVSGKITLQAETNTKPNNTLRVFIGEKLVIDGLDPKTSFSGRQGIFTLDEGAKRELPIRIEFSHNGPAASLQLLWSWDGKEPEVISAAAFKHQSIFAGDLLQTIETNDRPLTMRYTPDGNWLVAAGQSRSWNRWNRANRRSTATGDAGRGHNQTIHALTYNKAGSRVATIDYSGNLFIWNASNAQMMYHQQLPTSAGFSLVYTPDGTEIIVGTNDARVLRVLIPAAVR